MSRENRFCPDCGNLTEHVVIRLDETGVRRICVRCNSVHDVDRRLGRASVHRVAWVQSAVGEEIPRTEQ